MAATLKGIFSPSNRNKYIGKSLPTFRSAWEKRVMFMLDNNSKVYRWGSELFSLPYISPVDGKVHQYFPDFYVEVIGNNDELKRLIIEVKPKKQTMPPTTANKKKKTIALEAVQWAVNKSKWEAAMNYCNKNGIQFVVFTEDNIGI
jgi:hypothetical protein